MSKSLPEKEAPVTLRASTQLSARQLQAQAPGTVAAGQLTPEPLPVTTAQAESHTDPMGLVTVPALAAGAVTVLLGTTWMLRRRRRLAHRSHRHGGTVSSQPAPVASVQVPVPVPVPEPVRVASRVPEADVMAELASQFQDEPASLQPQQTVPAPLEHPQRAPSRMGVASQKRLITALMWVRTVAGGTALLAAIAIVVFWAIEAIDLRAGDTGLTRPLLLLLLAAWAASWGAGQLANLLHRSFFGRVHPKFDN